MPVKNDLRVNSDRRSSARFGDSKLKTDIYQVQQTFKDFVEPAKEVKQEIDRLDKKREARRVVFSALSPIVPVRRLSSLPDNIEDGNYERAAGLLALAAVNLPEDTRDLKSACKQIFKGELPKYDFKNYQTPFSFFRGTALEPVVNKMGKLGVKLLSFDKTLYSTKFGKFLRQKLNIDIDISNPAKTERFIPKVTMDDFGKPVIEKIEVLSYKVEGKSFSKLIGRALLRTPVISLGVLSLLELPALFKKVKNAQGVDNKLKEGAKQSVKSVINVTSITAGISLVGALLSKKGPAFSLIGMGIGSVIGASFSRLLQNGIDKLTDKN